jgi:Reverse transcriptase (RNA-dependent DNA polymerase)
MQNLSKQSTLSNLAVHTSFLKRNMANGSQIDSIYTDFSKAFDKVDHALLIFKLEKYGVRGSLLEWFKSFLTDRTQRIKFQSKLSDPIEVRSGVPQGAVLSPLLFKLFNNDLTLILLGCILSLFADDLKISLIIRSLNDTQVLQDALHKLRLWCLRNGMSLNEDKCYVITFTRSNDYIDGAYMINNTLLRRVFDIRDLGVILDSKLNFKKQIDKVVASGKTILGFVKRRAKEFQDPYLTKQLFNTLVLPVIEYVSPIWAPYRDVDIKRIESIQKQFLLFALRHLGFTGPQLPPYRNRLLLIDMIPLEERRRLASALLVFDILKSNINVPELKDRLTVNSNHYSTRSRRFLREEIHHSDFAYYEVISTGIRNFNSFAEHFDQVISKNTFKNRIMTQMKTIFNLG